MMMVSGWNGMVSPDGVTSCCSDLHVLHLEDARHHLLVHGVRLIRVGDRGDRELLGPLLVDDLHELPLLVDRQGVRIQSGEERGVELVGVDLDLSVLGADDRDLAADVLGKNEGAAGDVGHRLHELLDLDLVEIDVVAALAALLFTARLLGRDGRARRGRRLRERDERSEGEQGDESSVHEWVLHLTL